MKINKNDLLAVIQKVKPGVSKKEIIEQAGHLIFSNDEVATFNDQICILHPFTCEFPFSVKEAEFTKVLSGISESEIDLTLKDGNLNIKSKSTKASLSTIVGEESKVEHLIAQLKTNISATDFFKPLPKEFIDGLYLCAFSANKDVATGVRACVAVKGDTILSTDGIRASSYVMDKTMDEVLIPAKDAMELIKYAVVSYGISENWIHFKTEDGIIFNCKTMKGDYPHKQVLSIFEDVEPDMTFPAELKEAVGSVTILAEGDMDINKMVRITIEKNLITVKAEKERGWIEKTVAFEYAGEPITFIINPIFFTQILALASGFNLVKGKAQFASENFVHIMALPQED
jgi:HSP20 family molecular chaperone IbpA